MTLPTDTFLYGGDYNPEQWPEEVWATDMALLAEAGITSVTLNVFAWASLQPSADVYDFARLDRIVRTVSDAGMRIVLATSTAAIPAWMSLHHPDVNRVDQRGTRRRHGQRHNPCISSPTFRTYAAALAGKLAERYGAEPNLVAWHVSNEYGGFCWCDLCAEGFRGWLRSRYGTLEALNQAWNSAFWSHTYHSFAEIFPPDQRGDAISADTTSNAAFVGSKVVLPGAALDYRRFYGAQVLESYREEKAAIRRFDRVRPVTTNMMGTFEDYDYFTWSEDVDVVSWDSYPAFDTSPAEVSMRHDLMRAVGKQKPFMLMEQTPSRQNWQPYNSLKRPGQLRAQSWQAVARGADTVQYFQLRQSAGGCEKFHGAVIGANGSARTREFREVAALGAELGRVGTRVLGSQVEHGTVGIVFDWPSRWGIGFSAGPSVSLDYVNETLRWYTEVSRRNVPVDLLSRDSDLTGYDAVIAPCLYLLSEATIAALRAYVEAGGRLLLTPMSALVGESDLLFQGEAPVPFRDLAGVWIDETDALPPGTRVPVTFTDGGVHAASGEILADVVHADEGTQVLATYAGEFYAGTPALTFRPSGGGGGVLYAATFPCGDGLRATVDALLGEKAAGVPTPDGVQLSRRVRDDGTVLTFVVNTTGSAHTVDVDGLAGTDILGGGPVEGSIALGPYGVAVVEAGA
ncbi:beta-galactosidase [Xylanimonas allomyrinae]|uniref:Beta-galactosidase n=1 Tax=Xylanimonas allomyrinae TaxID=2509459 RepID=A0A4P6EP31_9MICO|nr:beta-galactosidase [Xylanimonas allomyrinae]QAY64216.1 beta-galactosidase [Xylanimonas allomyrinae]